MEQWDTCTCESIRAVRAIHVYRRVRIARTIELGLWGFLDLFFRVNSLGPCYPQVFQQYDTALIVAVNFKVRYLTELFALMIHGFNSILICTRGGRASHPHSISAL